MSGGMSAATVLSYNSEATVPTLHELCGWSHETGLPQRADSIASEGTANKCFTVCTVYLPTT